MGPVNPTIQNSQFVIQSTKRFLSPKAVAIAALAIGVMIALGIMFYRHYQSRTNSLNRDPLPSTTPPQTPLQDVQRLSELPLVFPKVYPELLPNEVLEFGRFLGTGRIGYKEVENGEWEIVTNRTIYRIKPTFEILEDIGARKTPSKNFEPEVEYQLVPGELKSRALPKSEIPHEISQNFEKSNPFGWNIHVKDDVKGILEYSLYSNTNIQGQYHENRFSESRSSSSCSSSNLTLQDFPPQFSPTPIPEAVETLGRLFGVKTIEKGFLESEEDKSSNIEDITWRVTYNDDRTALIGRCVAVTSQKPRQHSDVMEGYVSPELPESMTVAEDTEQPAHVTVPTWVYEQAARIPDFEVFGYQYVNPQAAGTRFGELSYEWWRAYGLSNGQFATRDITNQDS